MVMERRGGDIVSHLDQSHPGFAAHVTAAQQFRERLPQHIADAYARLRTLTADVDAFDLLGYLQLAAARDDADAGPLIAGIELAASALVDRSGRRPVPDAPPGDLEAIMSVIAELQQLRTFASLELMTAGGALDEVRAHAAAMRTGVRGPSYPWQERETLMDLFGTAAVADLLRKAVGCTVEEAVRIEEVIEELGGARLAARGAYARQTADELLQAAERLRRGERVADQRSREIAEQIAALPRAERERRIHRLASGWLGHRLGDTLSFTADEIGEHAGIGVEACRALLDLLAARFVEADADRPDVERFRDRPLLVDDAGRCFCPSGHLLLWGLRPALETALKRAGGKAFAVYERHRKRRIEERAVAALAGALRPDLAEAGLHYDAVGEDAGKRPELDGLLRVDNVLLLVEVKASSMRASARRGAPSSQRKWLEDEVGVGAAQARRAREALAAEKAATVYDRDHKPLAVDLEGVRRAFEVVVTLEDLPAIAPATWRLAEAGILPNDPIPWVVSLHELEIICSLVEWPAQLVHYLMRRRRLDEQRHLWAMEELDFFLHYLSDGLYWELDNERPGSPALLASQTDRLDEYYAALEGRGRGRPHRPQRRMHRDVRRLLASLDRLEDRGRIDAQLALLEVDGSIAERIASGAQRLRRSAARQQRRRDLTFVFDDFGITVVAVPPDERGELIELLQSYCGLKKHQFRAEAWVGFGAWDGPREPAQYAVVLDEPWEPDAELDRLVAALPTAQSAPPDRTGRYWRDGTWR